MQKSTLSKLVMSARLAGIALMNCLLAGAALAAQPTLSVNFEGGNAAGAPTLLAPTDAAGVVPLTNWNNINGNTVANAPLAGSDGAPTTVTISFTADESWGSGTGTSTPDHALFNGYLGPSNDGNYRPIFLNNVPSGAYKLIIYTLRDGSGAGEGFTINGNTNTALHVNSQGAADFNGNPVFVRGTSTNPNARDLCNYVQFDLVAPVNGTITIDARSESFRAPVNGLQLIALPAVAQLGVSFSGRTGENVPGPLLAPETSAGYLVQSNWNNINNSSVFNGVSGALNDSNGSPTLVTLTYDANDAWNNDGPTGTGDEQLFKGISKSFGGDHQNNYTFNNVTPGLYDVIVYLNVNGDGRIGDIACGGTTYYFTSQHTFAGSFIQITNKNPVGTRDTGNFVRFYGVAANAFNQIPLTFINRGDADGIGIAGFQLLPVPAVATIAASFTGRDSGNDGGYSLASATTAGLIAQSNWNNIANGPAPHNGVTGPLLDANAGVTQVTLTYDANDAWHNDGATGTGDEQMFKGISKANGVDRVNTYTFNNVRPGVYDLIAYLNVNGDGRIGDISANGVTYYFTSQHSYGGSFIQTASTDSGTRPSGNYVRFYGIPVSEASSQIPLTFINRGDPDGIGIAGFQLVRVFGPSLISATTIGNPNVVRATFSGAMNATALNPANYSLNNGVTVSAVEFEGPGSNVVRLTTSTMTVGVQYTLTVANAQDSTGLAVSPNPSATQFTYGSEFEQGGLTMKRYDGDGNLVNIKNKIANCVTPNRYNPNIASVLYGTNPSYNNEANDGNTENFGTQLYGLFVPPVSGNYQFAIASDDNSELYLSTDENPANKVLLTAETGCCTPFSAHTTAMISLVAGRSYYMQVLHQEGGGGDHVEVAIRYPGGPAIVDGDLNQVIPRSLFSTNYTYGCPPTAFFKTIGPVFFTQDLTSTNIIENTPFAYRVEFDGTPAYSAQWYSNGVAVAGVTSGSHSTLPFTVRAANEGDTFYVVVNNSFSSVTSVVSTLTVTLAPQVVDINSRNDPNGHIYVQFSKPMGVSALNPLSYDITGGITVNGAAFHDVDNTIVRLDVTPLTGGNTYDVTVGGVLDTDSNVVNPDPSIRSFTHLAGINAPQGLTIRRYEGTGDFNAIKNKIATCVTPQFINTEAATMEYSSFLAGFNDPVVRADPGLENYGAWIYGQFAPPTTGNYVFGLAADDQAELWLSTDSSPANKVLISSMPNWGGARDFVLPGNGNTVVPLTAGIPLVAGRTYYIEALFQEGGGGDHLSVAVQVPGGPAIIDGTQNVITRSLIATNYSVGCPPNLYFNNLGPVAITLQPLSTTVFELAPVTLRVLLDGSPNYSYQWRSNGVPVPGANGASYSFNPLRYANGATYDLVAANGFSSVTSAPAVLTVVSDEIPPSLVQVISAPSRTVLGIIFSEPMTLLEATNPANYTITNSLGAPLAHSVSVLPEVSPDGKSVTLRTDLQDSGGQYGLVVSSLTDRAGLPNLLVPNPTVVQFTASDLFYAPGAMVFRAYPTGGGNAIGELTNHPSYLNNTPDYEQVIFNMNSRSAAAPYNSNGRENYGGAIIGHFIPPTSGNWIFYISADDDGLLLMNTNGPNSSGKVPVRFAPGCCRALSSGADATPPISMLAGQAYYIEALYKEGGGGDYVEVAARRQGSADALVVIGPGNLAFASRLTITQNPTNLTVLEGQNASFQATVSVAGAGVGSQRYQWQRSDDISGATFTDIPGATSSSYTFRAFDVDDQFQFRVVAYLPGLQTNVSTAATLTVLDDTVPPLLLSARVGERYDQVILTYSEAINPAVFADASNFYIDENYFGSIREVLGSVIVLTLNQPLSPNTPYILYGDGQQDEFGNNTDPGLTESHLFIYQPFGLTHRYSFRNFAGPAGGSNVLDSVGGAHGQVLGAGASFTGERVALSGGPSATAGYIDLPNRLLSTNGVVNGGSGKLTLEGWVQVTGNQAWSRIVDFGSASTGELNGPGGGGNGEDYLFYGAQENVNTARRNIVVRDINPLPDGTASGADAGPAFNVSNFGTEFHYAITWDEATGQVRVYENNVEVASLVTVAPMHKIDDVNVWLGRSQWSGDANLQGNFNEFRMYNRIITPEERAFNIAVGPDNNFGVPLAVRLVVQTNVMLQSRTQQARIYADFSLTLSNVDLTATRTYTLTTDDPTLVSVSPSSVLSAGNIAGTANLEATFNGVSSGIVPIQVLTDNFPPTLISARVGEDLTTLYLTYSEDIDPNVASDASNFYLDDGSVFFGTVRVVNGPLVAVTLNAPVLPNTVYTLYGLDQADLFGNPTAPNPTENQLFAYQPFGLTHRYSFRNAAGAAGGATVLDSVGGAHGVVLGAGANFNGDKLILPGGSSASAAYVDLPNGLLSTNAVSNGGSGQVTIEGWTRVTGNQAWSRIFDFGSVSGAELPGPGGGGNGRRYLMLAAQVNVDVNTHRIEATADDGSYPNAFTVDFPALFNQVEHFVITWDDVNNRVRTYINGVQRVDISTAATLSDINDVNVWLGRSTWTGDLNMQGDFDEFRMYNRIISTDEIAFNAASGPNYSFGTPLAVRIEVPSNTMFENSSQQAQVFADFASISNVNMTPYRSFTLISDAPGLVSVSPSSLLTAGSGVSGIANLVATFAGVSSTPVAITVVQDTTKPSVVSVNGTRSLDSIKVVFSEPVLPGQATDSGNYSLTDTNATPVAFGSPSLGGDGRTVTIPVTGGHAAGAVFVLGISGIGDLAGIQNLMDPTNFTFQTWIWSRGFAIADFYLGLGGVLVADLTNNPVYPNTPGLTEYVSLFETRSDWADNYGAQLTARMTPPRSGTYEFYISSDDQGLLFLSTDADPANQAQIAVEPVWNGSRNYIVPSNGDGSRGNPASNIASNVVLTAGSEYSIRAVSKEGGGGDNLSATWHIPGTAPVVNGTLPIHGTFLSSLADPVGASITIQEQPQSTNIWAGLTVTLTATSVGTNVNGSAPVVYQWQRLVGGNWTDIYGANSAAYAITPVPPGHNVQYRALIFIPGASAVSSTATVVGVIAIDWDPLGILQEANEVTGPWTDIVPTPSNPFIVFPGDAPRKFYRLKP